METNTTVTGLVTGDGEVRGVTTESGRYTADAVVVAAGWRTREFLEDHLSLPIRPYRTQCLVLDPGYDLDEDFPLGRVPDEKVYFRPEHNGDLLMGGGSAIIADPEGASSRADEAFRDDIARLVPRVVEGFEDAGVVDGWAGVDAATPDGRAIVDDPADGPDGLVVATGFNGLGVMTAPAAAAAVTAAVRAESAPFDDVFSLARFDTRSAEFGLHSTFDMSH